MCHHPDRIIDPDHQRNWGCCYTPGNGGMSLAERNPLGHLIILSWPILILNAAAMSWKGHGKPWLGDLRDVGVGDPTRYAT